ncbi:hypothetical protein ABT112_16365 [Streptomyces sp. NPDC002055]|uniref:hypothetical protein n=1 Tax=Streptomyces sp. NPDC002055 TaxID=3154534 RepID=UPI0033329F3A
MNAAVAVARSRGLPRAAGICLVLALLASGFVGQRLAVPELRYLSDFSVPVAELVPIAHAVLLATTLFSPMADLEWTAAQPMRRHRAVHLLTLLVLAVGLCALPLAAGAPVPVFAAAVRNAVGYLGLGMISARLFGSGLAWLLPLGMFGPTLFLGVGPNNTPEAWAWSIQPAHDVPAGVAAAVLWAVGLVLAATGSPRRTERAEQQ